MSGLIRFVSPAVFLAALVVAAVAFAAGKGQDDLDKATEAKLSVDTVSDLSEVIRLTESALKKGLDEANTDFAKKLLASTLLQRAEVTTKFILSDVASPDEFRRRRQFALSDLEKAVELDPKQPQAFLLIAQLNLLPGGAGLKKVRESLDKAIELGDDEPGLRAKALVIRAELQERPEKKMADLDEAVRLMPGDAATFRARGLTLANMDKLDLALTDLRKALELDPSNGATYEAVAIVLARQKKYDEALATLDKVRRLSPDSAEPLLQRARIHLQQRKLDAALDDLTQALAMVPGSVDLLLLRASVYQEKGEKRKALADADRALKLQPNQPRTIRTHALLLAEDDRLGEATDELEDLAKLNPKDAETLLQLAMFYGAGKKSAKAIEAYTAVLALEPDEWQALRGRGDAYLNMGKQAEAVADYEKAIKLQPKDESVLNNLAWVLATSPEAKLRDGRRAIKLAIEACKLTNYKAAYILSTLAAAYAETGDYATAIKWSTKAVEIGDKQYDDDLKKELASYKDYLPWRELLTEEKVAEKKPVQEKPHEKKKKP
jgi:tetratricopeptide (TPR) repeat protein